MISKNNKYTLEDKNKSVLSKNFDKILEGFHCVSKEPLKECRWEEINCEIIEESEFHIKNKSSGSHKSGCDISCDLGNLSNKTGIIEKNNISLSSYRLTSVCDKKNIGNDMDIIKEIHKRDGSFDFYSLLARNETKEKNIKTKINYEWYLIPKNIEILNPSSYEWEKSYDKNGHVNGWKTKKYNGCEMKISFSMSSQLWITIDKKQIEKYKIGEKTIDVKCCGNVKYTDLYSLSELLKSEKKSFSEIMKKIKI